MLRRMFGDKPFDFSKSLYAVADVLRFFVARNPNALIVDFFAGSGTTLHAVNLLNWEDSGNRRCILVTNNEVSEQESKALKAKGHHTGDDEWEALGIARSVTWPRTVCSITGNTISGGKIPGQYGVNIDVFDSDDVTVVDDDGKQKEVTVYRKNTVPAYPKLHGKNMSDGFKSNAVYFKLGFLDKTMVALGSQFKELLSVLWMKAGCIGKCPVLESDALPDMVVYAENKFAVLINDYAYATFEEELAKYPEIQTVFIVTDSVGAYREMIKGMEGKDTYQLYRDYLDNFRINTGR